MTNEQKALAHALAQANASKPETRDPVREIFTQAIAFVLSVLISGTLSMIGWNLFAPMWELPEVTWVQSFGLFLVINTTIMRMKTRD